MQKELTALQPELIKTSAETEILMRKIEKDTVEVEAKKEVLCYLLISLALCFLIIHFSNLFHGKLSWISKLVILFVLIVTVDDWNCIYNFVDFYLRMRIVELHKFQLVYLSQEMNTNTPESNLFSKSIQQL